MKPKTPTPKLTKRQMARLEEIAGDHANRWWFFKPVLTAGLSSRGLVEPDPSDGRMVHLTPAGRALLAGSSERQI